MDIPTHTTTQIRSGSTIRRTAASVALAVAVALATLATLSPAASAATSGTLVTPVTDNYKARWNADPAVPELRTWLAFQAVEVAGVRFTPATVPASTTTVSAADGLALKGSDGSAAVLTASTTSTNVFHQGFFRVDPGGGFGLLQQLRTRVGAGSPIVETLTVSRNGTALGTVGASYTYDPAVANATSTSIEYNGPGGRWYVAGQPTRLDWEATAPVPVATPAAFSVGAPTAAATTPGSTVTYSFRVTNSGGTAARGYSMASIAQSAASPGARPVSVAASQGTCSISSLQCDLGTVQPGAGATVSVTVDVLRTNGFTLMLAASTTAGGIDGEGAVTPVVTGSSCTLIGTNGADTLVGTSGRDVVCGFGGNDLVRPGAGDDVVSGGAGTDTTSYDGQAGPVVVNLGQRSAWDLGTTKSIGWDTFTSVESAIGTAGADQLLGDAGANSLKGGAGADQIWGYDGDDSLVGGAGADKLYGGNGNDSFDGGTESDLCQQGAGVGTKLACETA